MYFLQQSNSQRSISQLCSSPALRSFTACFCSLFWFSGPQVDCLVHCHHSLPFPEPNFLVAAVRQTDKEKKELHEHLEAKNKVFHSGFDQKNKASPEMNASANVVAHLSILAIQMLSNKSDFQLVMEFYPGGKNLSMLQRPNVIFRQPEWEQAEQNRKQKTTNMSPD